MNTHKEKLNKASAPTEINSPSSLLSESSDMASLRSVEKEMQKLRRTREKLMYKEVKNIVARMKEWGITLTMLKASGAKAEIKAEAVKTKGRSKKVKTEGGRIKGVRLTKKPKTQKEGPDKRSVVAPKYKDPATQKTWTGRGNTPRWMADYENNGRLRTEFLIPE